MKRLYLLMVIVAMAATSCQQELDAPTMVEYTVGTNEQPSPYAISEEEALNRLDEFMSAFDCEETRSKSRTVRQVYTIPSKSILSQTRNSNNNFNEDLLYIVEFEGGEGSAILGADRRLEPVYAVLDETVLTLEDFQNAGSGDDGQDISAYTASLISDAVQMASIDFGDPAPLNPRDSLMSNWSDIVTVTTTSNYIAPLLNTRWGQLGIFNDKFPINENSDDGKQAAGCTTIALAQILNYLSYPTPIELNNNTFYWRDINQFTWNNTDNISDTYLLNQIGYFIRCLAEELNVKFEDDGSTSSNIDRVKRVLNKLNYQNLSKGELTKTRIYPELCGKRPVYTRGETSEGAGHAWVIDGFKTISRSEYCVTYDGFSNEIGREYLRTTITDYVHCNMGWDGECNGYYTMNIFDTTQRRNSIELETSYGDIEQTSEVHVFTKYFKTLTYTIF